MIVRLPIAGNCSLVIKRLKQQNSNTSAFGFATIFSTVIERKKNWGLNFFNGPSGADVINCLPGNLISQICTQHYLFLCHKSGKTNTHWVLLSITESVWKECFFLQEFQLKQRPVFVFKFVKGCLLSCSLVSIVDTWLNSWEVVGEHWATFDLEADDSSDSIFCFCRRGRPKSSTAHYDGKDSFWI